MEHEIECVWALEFRAGFLKMGAPGDPKGQKGAKKGLIGGFSRNCFGKCTCGFGSEGLERLRD